MAPAAEPPGHRADVHMVALGSETHASQFRFNLFKGAGHDDRFNRADVIDEALDVRGIGAGAGEVGLPQPEVGHLVVVGEVEMIVYMLEEADARERVGLINLVANPGEVRAALHEFGGDVVGRRPGVGILKRAGVGGNGREQAIGDRRGDGPAGNLEQAENQLASGRFPGRDPVDVAIARVAGVVVNVDQQFPVLNAFAHFAQPLETRAVCGNHAVEPQSRGRGLKQLVRVEKGEFLRHVVFVPTDDLLALFPQREGKAQLRTDAVSIRPDVTGDTKGPAAADSFEDAVDDLGVGFHEGGRVRSSSSRICSTRLPRSMESSRTKRSFGVYLSTTARPRSAWMRSRPFWRISRPLRCCSAVPTMPTKTVADCRSPASPTSLTVINPASALAISRRMIWPISRLSSSRTRWCRSDCM